MWAHGYRGQGTVLTVDPPSYGLRQRLLDQGYAWAASSYSGNGFDIRAGVVSTKELTERFARDVRRPHRTYIAGVSMGGYVIGRSLEEYPKLYDGGLPMCGVMGDQRLIDYFLDFQLTAEALSGVTTYPAGADYLTTVVPAVQQKLGIATITPVAPEPANALGRQFRDITVNQSGGQRPGAAASFAYWKDFVFSLSAPSAASDTPAQDPGLISTNLFTRYTPNAPVNVNREVRRVAPEEPFERLSSRLTQVPKIEGRPRVPVLSLHDLGDMFVPFSNEQPVQNRRRPQRPRPAAGPAGDPGHRTLRVQPGRGRHRLGRPGQLGPARRQAGRRPPRPEVRGRPRLRLPLQRPRGVHHRHPPPLPRLPVSKGPLLTVSAAQGTLVNNRC